MKHSKAFSILVVMLVMTCALLAVPQIASSSTFINFDIPSASGAAFPTGVNKWGTVTGYYSTSTGGYNSFLWQTSGAVTTVKVPGVSRTYAMGLNNTGWVVGWYPDNSSAYHGFLRNPQYTTLDVPGAGTLNYQGTQPSSINDAGQIAGVYWDSNSVEHGFIRDSSGNYTSFDVPGGAKLYSALLNQSGQIAGTYDLPSGGGTRGYLRDSSGNFTTFNVSADLTYVDGINSNGQIAGHYYVTTVDIQQFVRDALGNITTFTVSGYIATAGIADNGDVYGIYKNAGKFRGWKRGGTSGLITHVGDPSGSNGTDPWCVSGNGKVAGYYTDSQNVSHDFEMHN